MTTSGGRKKFMDNTEKAFFVISEEYLGALNGEGTIRLHIKLDPGFKNKQLIGQVIPFEFASKFLKEYKSYKITRKKYEEILVAGGLLQNNRG
jgi:hypothetical protein